MSFKSTTDMSLKNVDKKIDQFMKKMKKQVSNMVGKICKDKRLKNAAGLFRNVSTGKGKPTVPSLKQGSDELVRKKR